MDRSLSVCMRDTTHTMSKRELSRPPDFRRRIIALFRRRAGADSWTSLAIDMVTVYINLGISSHADFSPNPITRIPGRANKLMGEEEREREKEN